VIEAVPDEDKHTSAAGDTHPIWAEKVHKPGGTVKL
jgi:hypothetical protein